MAYEMRLQPTPSPTLDLSPPLSLTQQLLITDLVTLVAAILILGTAALIMWSWQEKHHRCVCGHNPHGVHTKYGEGKCWECGCRCYIAS